MTLALKLDNKITWEWKEVFWVYWAGLSILIGLSFGITLMLTSKIC